MPRAHESHGSMSSSRESTGKKKQRPRTVMGASREEVTESWKERQGMIWKRKEESLKTECPAVCVECCADIPGEEERSDLGSGRTGAIRHSDEALREEPGPERAGGKERGESRDEGAKSFPKDSRETGQWLEHRMLRGACLGVHELEHSPTTEWEKTAVRE